MCVPLPAGGLFNLLCRVRAHIVSVLLFLLQWQLRVLTIMMRVEWLDPSIPYVSVHMYICVELHVCGCALVENVCFAPSAQMHASQW